MCIYIYELWSKVLSDKQIPKMKARLKEGSISDLIIIICITVVLSLDLFIYTLPNEVWYTPMMSMMTTVERNRDRL
jgi:uncharacterized membrane protein